jgi:hypothetical protein
MGARIPDAMGGKGEETRRRLALSEAVVERLETALADKSRALEESVERERALEATIAELRAAPSRDEQMTEMREKLEAATRETESLRASTLALASTRAPSDPEEDAALAVRVATAEGSLATSRARLDVAETALAEWRTHAEARSILRTGPHATASARRAPFLEDFLSRRAFVSLRPGSLAFNPRHASTPHDSASDAFELHPDVASYGRLPSTPRR